MAGRPKRVQSKASRRKGSRGPPNLGGSRAKAGKNPVGHLEKALESVARFIAAARAPSTVIGGIAVIAHGVARFTSDIDVAVVIDPSQAHRLLAAAASAGLTPRIDGAEQFAEQNMVLLLRHQATGVEVDVSFAMQAFEVEAARSAIRRKLGSVVLPITPLEALLVYKMVAGRPQDIDDVTSLLARGEAFDAEDVTRTLRELDAVLDTNRVEEFSRLLRDR